MIYLLLFWTFFKIGLFTIGGGYAMIPLIQQALIEKYAWVTPEQFAEFVGIAESTPGPFAINISTFSGLRAAEIEGGIPILGSLCSTAGVILPSLLIILIIVALFHNALKHWSVRAALEGAKPVVVGLIAAAAVLLLQHALITADHTFRWQNALFALLLFALTAIKRIGPIHLILLGAGLGLLLQCVGISL